MINKYRISSGKLQRRYHLRDGRIRWKELIKFHVRKLEHEDLDITSSEFVSAVFLFEHDHEPLNSIKAGYFLINRLIVNCSWYVLYHES